MRYGIKPCGAGKKRSLRKRFVIAAEGEVTEPQYFTRVASMNSGAAAFDIVENNGNGSDPKAVLARMKQYLKSNPLEKNDEAWIVIDQDRWTKSSIQTIKDWCEEKPGQRYCAISIRRFEDWLKLHVIGDKTAEERFKKNISGQDKSIPDNFATKKRVEAAVAAAKKRFDTSRSVGDVFKLVEAFLAAGK